LIKKALEVGNIKIYVLIRPRAGDFLYSHEEFEIMQEDIIECKKLGVHGVVFGLLLPDGNIDITRTKILVELARPMNITFHRAYDLSRNPIESLEDIIKAGCDRILTSGH